MLVSPHGLGLMYGRQAQGSPTILGTFLGCLKTYRILEGMLRSPYLWKLPHRNLDRYMGAHSRGNEKKEHGSHYSKLMAQSRVL